MEKYAQSLIWELTEPLVAALDGSLDGPGQIATVLLCETLLCLVPKMSLKDMPYKLLQEYNIMPIEGGVIGSKRRLCLSGIATLHGGVLYVPSVHPFERTPWHGTKASHSHDELFRVNANQ